MTTTAEIIAACQTRQPSDDAADPPRIALLEFGREDLLAALTPPRNERARELLAGVTACAANKMVCCQREHILEALVNDGPAEI